MPASRPIEASKAAIGYVRNTSTAAVCAAQWCADVDAGARLDAGPGYSPSRRLRVSELVGSAPGCPPSADAARRLSRGPRSGGRQFDPCPGAEDRVSFGQLAMAMDLRRRNQQHVMETMDGKTTAPRAHEF